MHEQDLSHPLRARRLKQADVTAASRLLGVDKTHAAYLLVELIKPEIGSVIREARLRKAPVINQREGRSLDTTPKKPRMEAAIEVFNHLF